MIHTLLLLCSLFIQAADVSETEQVAPSSWQDKMSAVGYCSIGGLGFLAGVKLLSHSLDNNMHVALKILGASALATWLIKETCNDVGYTWVALKQELEEFKNDRDAYAEAVGVELSSAEKTVGEIAQTLYLLPSYYWLEMISLPCAAVLLKYVYTTLNKPRLLKI